VTVIPILTVTYFICIFFVIFVEKHPKGRS
jgi:hypothetical protein